MKTEIKIEGMSCGHCVAAVKSALESIPGVQSAEVTLEPGLAIVEGSANFAELEHAIKEEGYRASLLQPPSS